MAFGAVMTWQSISMGVESKAAIEAGTSPVGIGGTLEQFPSVLFPAYPESEPLSWRAHGLEAPSPNSRFQTVPVQIEPPYPIFLPTHVELPLPPVAATVAAASAPVQYNGVLSESEVVALLRAAGAPEAWIPDLVVISWCESKHSPGAVGDSGNSLGQYQLWSGWFRAGEDPFDPLTNARVAVRVRETRGRFGGAGGWSCAGLNGIP